MREYLIADLVVYPLRWIFLPITTYWEYRRVMWEEGNEDLKREFEHSETLFIVGIACLLAGMITFYVRHHWSIPDLQHLGLAFFSIGAILLYGGGIWGRHVLKIF